MIVPVDQHATVTNEQVIDACRSMLDTLNQAIRHRRWSLVSEIAAGYSKRIRQLDMDNHESVRADLAQLEIRHRRCMRMLAQHMNAVAADIASLEAGQKSVQRTRAVAESLFQ